MQESMLNFIINYCVNNRLCNIVTIEEHAALSCQADFAIITIGA